MDFTPPITGAVVKPVIMPQDGQRKEKRGYRGEKRHRRSTGENSINSGLAI